MRRKFIIFKMKAVELALKAGRKRQSPITGYIHHPSRETIPVYENFCFALALLRSKTAENVLEAKALLERLFTFRVKGQFPHYLHEYPECRFQQKLHPVVTFILKEFQPILGGQLKAELQELLTESVAPQDPHSPEKWAELLLHSQLTGEAPTPAPWDPQSLSFVGQQRYEKGEPAVTLYDLFLGERGGRYSARALQDHPSHLTAALVYPGSLETFCPAPSFRYRFWGNGHPTHSLVLETSGAVRDQTIFLPEKEVHDEVEVAYFCNLPNEILVEGKKATTFQLGQRLQVGGKIELIFKVEGDGQYWGHLYRGNRPGQLFKDEAYDNIIALRTVKRSLSSTVKIGYKMVHE